VCLQKLVTSRLFRQIPALGKCERAERPNSKRSFDFFLFVHGSFSFEISPSIKSSFPETSPHYTDIQILTTSTHAKTLKFSFSDERYDVVGVPAVAVAAASVAAVVSARYQLSLWVDMPVFPAESVVGYP